MRNSKLSLNGSQLKMIAIISMMVDHTGAAVIGPLRTLLPEDFERLASLCRTCYPHMRSIGRLAFPIFCFLLVEGFFHTRNVWKYVGRLALFALVSEIPFDYALKGGLFVPGSQNVYFTLLIGMLVMIGVAYVDRLPRDRFWKPYLYLAAVLLIVAAGLYSAKLLNTDYRHKGVFLIMVLYFLHMDHRVQTVFGAIAISWEVYGPLGFIPVWFYNGERGRQHKYFFYWFYPIHLMILGILRHLVIPALLGISA
ncbi:MAG: TraX family protein [Eubacteriales bacterium]|nr:TraX family protein [Eubacteriales bacterium]